MALAILGPGSIIIFIVFVRDLLRPPREDADSPGVPDGLKRQP